MKNKTLALVLPLMLAGCGQPKNLPTSHINIDTYVQHIKSLGSDQFGGRAPGTKGETLTVNYLVNEFQKAGLQPANGDKYTQDVPLTSVEVVSPPTLIIQGGEGEDMLLGYPDDQVVWTRKQIPATGIAKSEIVFVGYGINAPERNWNDYAGIDVKGKTVVMLVNDPGYATQDPNLFNGNAMTYYGRWDYKMDEAARQGAAGAIIIHDTKPAAYPWSTVSASWTGPQFDLVLPDKGASLASIEGWITKEHAKTMFTKAGLDLNEMYKAAQTPGFKAVELNLAATTGVKNKLTTINSQNVVGMIKGSESPEDVFIYMAHWDHIGIDPTKEGDNIYNGALDNATGTAGLIELAKAFGSMKTPPKRSVMFLAITAEEQGLLGSAYYANNPLFPLKNTIAGLNMDGMSYFGRARDITLISKGNSHLDAYVENRAKQQGRVVVADPKPEKGSFYRSDHFELSKKGVPMIYAKPGFDHREKGLEYGLSKMAEYVSHDYHRPSDEYHESWDMSGAIEDLELFYWVGLDIVDSGKWPGWVEGTEFKAIRDQQRAGE